jgi:hypothetical protein
VFEIFVFLPDQIDDLFFYAILGSASARRLIRPVANAAARILSAPHKLPALCLCCPRPVRGRAAVCLVMPYRDDATVGIGSGLCTRCSVLSSEVLNARILAAVRRIWPDARTIGRVSEGPEMVQ